MPVQAVRFVRVRAVIERPPPAPGCAVPFPEHVDWWDGRMLAWRWIDREQRLWTGLVEYSREGLLHHHWVHGDLIAIAGAGGTGTASMLGS